MPNQAGFTRKDLHEERSPSTRQLDDKDLLRYMPTESPAIRTLSPINIKDSDGSTEVVSLAIQGALSEESIRHFFVPMGPGHWQGLYIEKPQTDNGLYQIRIFDSFGQQHIEDSRVIHTVISFLKNCRIEKNQIEISLAHPSKLQTGSYACGDFMCAYFLKEKERIVQIEEPQTTSLSPQETLTISDLDKLGDRMKIETVKLDLAAYLAKVPQDQSTPAMSSDMSEEEAYQAAINASLLEQQGTTDHTSIDSKIRAIFTRASARIAGLSTPISTESEAEATIEISRMTYAELKTKVNQADLKRIEQSIPDKNNDKVTLLAAGLLFARREKHSAYKKAVDSVKNPSQPTHTGNQNKTTEQQIAEDEKVAAAFQDEEFESIGIKL